MNPRSSLLLIIGLLVSTFFGGAIRAVFSPTQIRKIVIDISNQKQPKFDIDFKGAQLRLARGVWPTLAIELTDIKIAAKDSCITNSMLVIDRLLVPFQLTELIKKKIKFGHIRAGQILFHYRPATCSVATLTEAETDSVLSLERFFQKRWSKEVVNTAKILEAVSFESLHFIDDAQALPPAEIISFEMGFLPDLTGSELNFQVLWGGAWVGPAPIGKTTVKVEVRSDEVTLESMGNLKEGQYKANMNWSIDRGEITAAMNTQDIPTNSLLQLLEHWQILKNNPLQMKNQWVDCDLTVNGQIRNFFDLPISLHQCRLYGELGEMQVRTQQIKSLKQGGEIEILIQKLDLNKIFFESEFRALKNFAPDLGSFAGVLTIQKRNQMLFVGSLQNVELYISKFTERWRQKIKQVDVNLTLTDSGFRSSFVKFEGPDLVTDGQARVEISYQGDGLFSFSFLPVQFISKQLFFGGLFSEMKLAGQGRLQKFAVRDYRGRLFIESVEHANWKISKFQADMEYADSLWQVALRSESFEFLAEHPWLEGLKLIYLKNGFEWVSHEFKQIYSDVQWDGDAGSWSNFRAHYGGNSQILKSSGSWNMTEGISGRITLPTSTTSKVSEQFSSWHIDGSWQKPIFKAVEN